MARRTQVVCVRLTETEAEGLDRSRGVMTRTEYLRWLLLQDRKRAT